MPNGTRPGRTPQDRLAGKKPRTLTVPICLDDALAVAHEQAGAALETRRRQVESTRARRLGERRQAAGPLEPEAAAALVEQLDAEDAAALAPLQDAVDAAATALDEATVWFTFRSLGRRRWRELVAAHPPTEEDQAAAKAMGQEKADWNLDDLPRALLPLACVSPGLTLEQVDEMLDGDDEDGGAWNDAELMLLSNTAILAQTGARSVNRPAPVAP